MADYDVIVIGAGNAALSAAVSARTSGANRVLVLEKAPKDRRGGNTHFSGGLLRYTFDSKEQAIDLIPNVEKDYPEYRDGIDPYPAQRFREDVMKVTGGRSDPQLSDILVNQSYPTVRWMQQMGIAMEPARSSGGEWAADETAIEGVRRGKGVRWQPGVRYLGGQWGAAKVRGCAFNHGDGLRMALELGALPVGDWRGCHATPISQDAPPYADPFMTDKTNRLSYVYGVMLNLEGKRFLDEGYDVHPMTYALYGGLILAQPEGQAYQIFDSKVVNLLEGRYATEQPISADTLEALFDRIRINKEQALRTIRDYNEAAGHGTFVPTKLDGMHTQGLTPPKTNWAQRLDKGPYVAYPVTGGITFTFGGLKIDENAQVIANNSKALPGLFCCGEAVGGIFHGNYPAGTGVMAGAVFGRIAGASAAKVS